MKKRIAKTPVQAKFDRRCAWIFIETKARTYHQGYDVHFGDNDQKKIKKMQMQNKRQQTRK